MGNACEQVITPRGYIYSRCGILFNSEVDLEKSVCVITSKNLSGHEIERKVLTSPRDVAFCYIIQGFGYSGLTAHPGDSLSSWLKNPSFLKLFRPNS